MSDEQRHSVHCAWCGANVLAYRQRSAGPRRKLTDDQEREIARVYGATTTPASQISSQFGISESSVYRVAERHGLPLRGRKAVSAAGAPPTAEPTAGAATTTTQAQPAARRRRRGAGGVRQARGRAARSSSASPASDSGGTVRVTYRVTFIGVRVIEAAHIRDAIAQAEASGATDITGIVRTE